MLYRWLLITLPASIYASFISVKKVHDPCDEVQHDVK